MNNGSLLTKERWASQGTTAIREDTETDIRPVDWDQFVARLTRQKQVFGRIASTHILVCVATASHWETKTMYIHNNTCLPYYVSYWRQIPNTQDYSAIASE